MADHVGRPGPLVGTLAVVVVASLALMAVLAWAHARTLQSSQPAGDVPAAGPRPPASADQQILSAVGLGVSDVGPGDSVSLVDQGDQLSQPTLDFCGLRFASERQREARRQVAASDTSGLPALSTEAVLYHDQAGAAEAMGEVRGIHGRCPSGPVQSPSVGEPSLVWRVRDASTSGWPHPAPMDRIALDVTVGRPGQDALHQVVVFLRRGRLLLGVYFASETGSPVPVAGVSTLGGVVGLFQQRVAALPEADVS